MTERRVSSGDAAGTQIIRICLRSWNRDSLLRAWFDHFDDDRNGFLEYDEFNAVADRIAHPNPYQLWQQLDSDRTGYVSLRDISEDDAQLWFEFRTFCGANFKSAKDMMVQILGINSEEERKEQKQISRSKLFGLRSSSKAHKSSTGAVRAGEECSFTITEEAWTSGLTRCGWQKHLPELFYALKDMRTGLVDATSLRWVEPEVRKYNQKQEMRRRTGAEQKAKAAARKSQRANLQNFKIFLRNRFGPTYHAWRKVLDTDGTMNLQRPELKKVCRQIGWKGDTTCLWLALDNGGNGTASLEELDPSCARQLARFRSFGEKRFGNRPAYGLWKAIDKQEKQRISHDLFVRRCLQMGAEFAEPELKELVYWLDWQEKKCITFQDIEFLDGWRPPAYLVAERNPKAAQEIRSLLLAKYGHFLKAWRTVLDKDNSNVCNWDEFYQAIKNLKYHGDIAGAWLALDEDLSGSITLSEIDSHSSEMLMKFKKWAVDQYGSVRTAFQVLDRDRSNELSLPEFRHAALVNGLSCCDDVRLFKCLDCGGHGRLLLSDVNFLDDWEANDAEDDDKLCAGMGIDEDLETKNSSNTQSRVWTEVPSDSMYGYATIAPGPGAYDHLASFGACSRMPTARHSGATSFRRRPESSWLKTSLQSVEPGGFAQDPKDSATQRRHKPAFRFSDRPRLPKEESYSPGPGTYSATSALSGPRFSMGCRRGFVLHPLQTPPFSARTSQVAGRYCFQLVVS